MWDEAMICAFRDSIATLYVGNIYVGLIVRMKSNQEGEKEEKLQQEAAQMVRMPAAPLCTPS